MLYVYDGKVFRAGQYVRLNSADVSKVLEVSHRSPLHRRNASLIGVWYKVEDNGNLTRVWL